MCALGEWEKMGFEWEKMLKIKNENGLKWDLSIGKWDFKKQTAGKWDWSPPPLL